jgi:hypothetical protein
MPITRLEMASFTFHFEAKRDRNAGETERSGLCIWAGFTVS